MPIRARIGFTSVAYVSEVFPRDFYRIVPQGVMLSMLTLHTVFGLRLRGDVSAFLVGSVFFLFTVISFGVMVGGKSRGGMRNSAERIKGGIPQTEIIELPGEGHSAMTSSPEMFASAVLAFFNGANR